MDHSPLPITKHISGFLDYCEVEKGLAEKTQENYGRYLSVFVKWLKKSGNGDLLPHQLTPQHIWDYRLYLSRKHKTPAGENLKKVTQNYYLVAVRALLDYFTDRDIDSLPSGKIKLPKGANKDSVKFLSEDQIKKLLDMPDTSNVKGMRDRAIMETLFSTGLRIAELVALNRDQINIKNTNDVLELTITGKGDRTRPIFLSPRALYWIDKYLKTREDIDNPLFVNLQSKKEGKRLSKRAIQSLVSRYAKMAALPVEVTPHVMRHSFATYLLSQGVDLRTVQEFLGHKNIATTQIYTHVTNKRLRDVYKKISDIK